jgi:LacI family transcriptional regulator
VATVSRVLNGTHVHPDLADRVNSALTELAYRPNRLARTLRRQKSMVLGLVVSDVMNPFFTGLARAVEDVASASGYSLLLCNSDEDPAKEAAYIDILVGERVAGILLTPASERSSTLDSAILRGIPAVAIDRRITTAAVDTVIADNFAGARDAVMHLIDGGARRIAILVGDPDVTTARERLEGYRAALRLAGIAYNEELVLCADLRGSNAGQLVHDMLSRTNPPDGLFLTTNLFTERAVETLLAEGVKIPEDLKSVGYDTHQLVRLLLPGLAVVRQPTYDMGRRAAELLLERIPDPALPPREVQFTPRLEVGASQLSSSAETGLNGEREWDRLNRGAGL